MKFYNSDFQPYRKPAGPWIKWLAVVIIAAVAGSVTTFVVMQGMQVKTTDGSSTARTQPPSTGAPAQVKQVTVQTSSAIVDAVDTVKPAIVGVVNIGKVANPFTSETVSRKQGLGSGVLFDPGGLIVTNNHVVAGASSLEVVLASGKHLKAEVVGTDDLTDLAVIRVPRSEVADIKPAAFGDSSALKPGEPAIAIGNPLGLEQTVTVGVISATKRMLPLTNSQGQEVWEQDVIQTDAAINPGNSGGALCNIDGQVIGINSEKITSQGVEGLGFAIPSNEVKKIVGDLVANGKVTRPGIGIKGRDLDVVPDPYRPPVPVNDGVFVVAVNDQARAAGIQAEDVIVAVDGQPVKSLIDLRKRLYAKQPGDTVTITLYRGTRKITVQEKLLPL